MQRIRALDGWRGVAILLVIVGHLASYEPRAGYHHGAHVGNLALNLGGFGVDVFFALSGFIITLRLVEEDRSKGRVDLKAFYVRRAYRILPPAVLYLAVLCVLSQIVSISDFRWSGVAGSLLFLRNYEAWYGRLGVYTAHFWSLAVEEHFYLFWPGLFLVLGRRRAAWVACACAALCAAWRHYDVSHLTSFHWQWIHPTGTEFPVRTDVRLDGILLGSALAIAVSYDNVRSTLQRVHWMVAPSCFAIAVITVHAAHLQPRLATNVLLASTVCLTAVQTKGPLYRVLNFPVLLWIGEVSYSLYVWQQLFLLRPDDRSTPLRWFNHAPWSLLMAFGMAACSFYLLEQPLIRAGKRWHKPRLLQTPV